MSKFANKLSASNKDIREDRAEMLSQEVALEVSTLVTKLEKEKLQLRNKISRLTDLAPDSKDSLRPTSNDFCPATWVSELHKTNLDLKLKTIELDIAKDINKEWFSEEN